MYTVLNVPLYIVFLNSYQLLNSYLYLLDPATPISITVCTHCIVNTENFLGNSYAELHPRFSMQLIRRADWLQRCNALYHFYMHFKNILHFSLQNCNRVFRCNWNEKLIGYRVTLHYMHIFYLRFPVQNCTHTFSL